MFVISFLVQCNLPFVGKHPQLADLRVLQAEIRFRIKIEVSDDKERFRDAPLGLGGLAAPRCARSHWRSHSGSGTFWFGFLGTCSAVLARIHCPCCLGGTLSRYVGERTGPE
jgi:hypothetical protein